jgi:glycosyltransferase involved in cell wall biosynthesis
MRASFIITNHNYARYVDQAITSCLHQTHDDVEIVVVDDGSTDDSRDVIASFGPAVTAVFQDNQGQAAAFNAGFAAATGELVCLLDADDLATPERAARAVALVAGRPTAGWLFHQLTPVDADDQPLGEARRATSAAHQPTGSPTAPPVDVDWRPHAAAGKLNAHLPFPLPATSGLCLRADLVARLAPLPVHPGILINDNYIKFAALGLCPGVMVDEELGRQRLHGANQLTSTAEGGARLAAVDATTALELMRHGLGSPRFNDNLVAQALHLLYRSGNDSPAATTALDHYLAACGPRRRRRIHARRYLYRIRSRLRREPPPNSLPPGVERAASC